ncbi:MAG: hypothetical protein GX640_13760, partial [Fibrobacter sp.]|nr:hypothetical protein [Fibrobacter sp.]
MKLGFQVLFLTIAFAFGVTKAEMANEAGADLASASSENAQNDSKAVSEVTEKNSGESSTSDAGQDSQDEADAQDEAKGKVLDSLIIEGLVIRPVEEVRRSLEIREGKVVTSADVQESIRRLYSTGLYKVVDFYTVSESDQTVILKIVLEEYPIFENIEYSGNKKFKVKDFEEKIKLRRGQVLTDDAIFDVQKKIRDMYGEKGYNLVEIQTDLRKSNIPGNVLVKFNISEGPRVRVASITFHGNNEVKTSRLER